MTAFEITLEVWMLRRKLDMGVISIREFLRQAAELQKQQDADQDH